jgi:hypothetical protein
LYSVGASDHFQDPDSLLKLFVILATSPEADLGFDTSIERVFGKSDFDVQFSIEGTGYRTTKVLFDVGADAPTGRGTRVFEVEDLRTGGKCVIKDCWVEDRPGKEMEHNIAARIKERVGKEEFCEYFIDVCGHRRTDMSGSFEMVCQSLKAGTFNPGGGFHPKLVVPPTKSRSSYMSGAPVANQDHYLRPAETKAAPSHPPHPRFRYQIVYKERGISLFEVTSLEKVFLYISHAAEGATGFTERAVVVLTLNV